MRVNDTLPEGGTVIDWDIAEILERPSIDVDWVQDWDSTLEDKRDDRNYRDIVTSIERWGFVRPLTAYIKQLGDKEELRFGDGHHRLAAAIELGMTTVPVEVFSGWKIATDSGSWNLSKGIDAAREVTYCS